MSEFTGERVIPGQVHDDLWAEHVSRYAFAERFAPGRRILDLGCGTGYGTATLGLATTAGATGLDVSGEALSFAAAHYLDCRWVQASAVQLPFARGFDLVTAFEVIEHLVEWRLLLREVQHVLNPGGIFLVSTPNRLYYAESRAEHGPNPFHHHEFEFEEFRAALQEFFPHVTLYLQNRLEAFAFTAAGRYTTADAAIDDAAAIPAEANFFVAVCSTAEQVDTPALIYVPRATNLLREREHHIGLLADELEQKEIWLEKVTTDRDSLLEIHTLLQKEFHERGKWAEQLHARLSAAEQRIAQLQTELDEVTQGYQRHIQILEEENVNKTQWALDTEQRLTQELAEQTSELARAVELLSAAEATVEQRTAWAQKLDADLNLRRSELEIIRQSRWLKVGRKLGLGPRIAQ